MNKNLVKLLVKVLITSALLFWFLYRTDIDSVVATISQMSLLVFAGANAIHFVALLFGSAKWKVIIPEFKYIKLFKLYIIGSYYSLILLGQVSGEVAKAYILGKENKQVGKIASSVIIDKITGLVGLFLLSLIGILCTTVIKNQMLVIGFSVGMITCIVLLFAIRIKFIYNLSLGIFAFIEKKIPKFGKLTSSLISLMESWREFTFRSWAVVLSLLMGIIYQIFPVIIFSLLGYQFGIVLSFFDWCWIIGFISIVLLLPVSIAGLGVREGTLIGLLGWLGFAPEKALALSFSILGVQIIGAALGAFFEIKRKND